MKKIREAIECTSNVSQKICSTFPSGNSQFRLFKQFTCAFFAVLVCVQFSGSAISQEQIDYARVVKSYLEASFSNDHDLLQKFDGVSELNFDLACYSYSNEKCESINDYVKFSKFSVENMKLVRSEHGQLHIVFADVNKLSDQAMKLSHDFSGGYQDTEDTDCQFYLKLDKNNIAEAAINVSLEAQPQKITSCLLVGFYRSMGLHLKEGRSFSYAWSGGAEPFHKLNIDAFSKLKKYISLLAYIHACPKLKSGMNKSQVEQELVKNSMCLKNLRPVG